jgi:hypothetical protein
MLLTCMVRRVYGAGDPSIKSVRTDMSKHDGLPETLVTDVLVIFGSTPLNHGPQILSVGHIRSLAKARGTVGIICPSRKRKFSYTAVKSRLLRAMFNVRCSTS